MKYTHARWILYRGTVRCRRNVHFTFNSMTKQACIFVGPSPMIFHLDIWTTLNLNIPLFGRMAWPPIKKSDEADMIINFYINTCNSNNTLLVGKVRIDWNIIQDNYVLNIYSIDWEQITVGFLFLESPGCISFIRSWRITFIPFLNSRCLYLSHLLSNRKFTVNKV